MLAELHCPARRYIRLSTFLPSSMTAPTGGCCSGETSRRGLAWQGQFYHSTPRQVWLGPLSMDRCTRLCVAAGNGRE